MFNRNTRDMNPGILNFGFAQGRHQCESCRTRWPRCDLSGSIRDENNESVHADLDNCCLPTCLLTKSYDVNTWWDNVTIWWDKRLVTLLQGVKIGCIKILPKEKFKSSYKSLFCSQKIANLGYCKLGRRSLPVLESGIGWIGDVVRTTRFHCSTRPKQKHCFYSIREHLPRDNKDAFWLCLCLWDNFGTPQTIQSFQQSWIRYDLRNYIL